MKTPADIKRLEELFHQAIHLEPEARSAFVAQVRSSDPLLGAEMESLLEAYGRDGSFLDSPAYTKAANVIADAETAILSGRSLGRYRILGQIGKGGMGEVYLAEDPQLGRKVALKLLPARLTGDKDRLRRFVQEARAASALNHPNITTVHEFGESEGTHFIAIEFIEGETLRKRLVRGPTSLAEVLDIAVQIAGAIVAAHAAGIVHRDIKPENIMLRRDGYLKVLDFGIAKLTEVPPSTGDPIDSQIGTAIITGTQPGVILGTVNYMSPEQARGRNVDSRSDVFSLGIVIYEMATGQAPFSGETSTDILVSILEKEPPLLSHFVKEAPAELQRIVSKALQKDREKRYQTASDLLIDLKNLRDEIAFNERMARSRSAVSHSIATQPLPIAITNEREARITLDRRKKRHLFGVVTAIALVGTLSIAGAWLWPRLRAVPVPSSIVTSPERSLSYWMMVQKYRDGRPYQEPIRLRDDINFERDYRVRLNISSAQSGYLYLLNEGPGVAGQTPSFVLMFPSATTNQLSAMLKENEPIQIPEQSWFQFDKQEGTEKIWLVWADQVVDELEAVKSYSNARDKGLIRDSALSTRVYEFLNSNSSFRPSVERDEKKTETALRANGQVLVHSINLSHH